MSAITERTEQPAGLPEPVARRGIGEAQWRTLCQSLYPGANPQSVLMVWDYCRARQLDPLKKPCHIVPMRVKDAKTGQWAWRDVVMPGIYEYRTTATRTGLYLGHSKPEYGFESNQFGVDAPEWCEMTVYRWSKEAHRKIEFPVRIYFREVCGTRKDDKTNTERANGRWEKAPIQMLTKCAEAAALREAFPDEFGGTSTLEEFEGRAIDFDPEVKTTAVAKLVTADDSAAGLIDEGHVADALIAMSDALQEGDADGLSLVYHSLDQEHQTAVWNLLNSKQRTMAKKMLAQAQDEAAESTTTKNEE